MESGNKVTNTSNPVSRRTCALQNEIDRLRAELTEARRLLDEARTTFVGIAGATARAWELPRNEFIDEFLPWAQSRARDAVEKMKAAPVPAQPAVPDDVAKDAARYRWLRKEAQQGAVRTLLPLTRCHYVIVNESAYDHPTFDEAIDAAILSATDAEGRKDE